MKISEQEVSTDVSHQSAATFDINFNFSNLQKGFLRRCPPANTNAKYQSLKSYQEIVCVPLRGFITLVLLTNFEHYLRCSFTLLPHFSTFHFTLFPNPEQLRHFLKVTNTHAFVNLYQRTKEPNKKKRKYGQGLAANGERRAPKSEPTRMLTANPY